MRHSRYFGRAKTQFPALMAAAVANFTLTAGWIGSEGGWCAYLRCVWWHLRQQNALRVLTSRLWPNRETIQLPAAAQTDRPHIPLTQQKPPPKDRFPAGFLGGLVLTCKIDRDVLCLPHYGKRGDISPPVRT